jgi:hypothetical protein
MSSQSSFNPLRKQYDAGDNKEDDFLNTQNNGASQFSPRQIRPPPPDASEEPLNIASMTPGEHRIYDYLRAHAWNETNCSIYFRHVRAMQEILVEYFRAQGLSEDQLRAFSETCDSELPEQLSTPPATDYEWQVKLVEEMNRRKKIGDDMAISLTSESVTHDQSRR